jgi:hypothetical protein
MWQHWLRKPKVVRWEWGPQMLMRSKVFPTRIGGISTRHPDSLICFNSNNINYLIVCLTPISPLFNFSLQDKITKSTSCYWSSLLVQISCSKHKSIRLPLLILIALPSLYVTSFSTIMSYVQILYDYMEPFHIYFSLWYFFIYFYYSLCGFLKKLEKIYIIAHLLKKNFKKIIRTKDTKEKTQPWFLLYLC